MGSQRRDFAEFYRESCDNCLRAVLVTVGDQDMAGDLVDEAFARAFASWRTVSRHPAPAAWVVRTALNANISRWRRRRREVPMPDPGLMADPAAADAAADRSVDPRIMAALLGLPVRQRQVVALRLFIRVTIRELQNPAELQSRLRADGVPASVTLTGQENPACRPYPASATLQKRVLSITFDVIPLPHQGPPPSTSPPQPNLVLVFHINPSALPPGTGLQLATSYTPVRPGLATSTIRHDLVYASPQCTGS